ncbi:hypothetical protein [Synechococcus sp. PCC 7336]|uniref:glycosyltransferase family 39 protein n=1 Tax=Synechococcus sp. PCC 7336 TaxID=195250 RepID=UPI000348E5F2|nr:hypothetical protein [Synechococcus sp. PCC 7336]
MPQRLRPHQFWPTTALVLLWTAIAFALRFTLLDSKPPWGDEWSTLAFSLGHGYRDIPLDRPIAIPDLLAPLQVDRNLGPADTVRTLMAESTHPPLYFALSHLWLQLLSPTGLVSLWLARAFSALLGVAAIPATFFAGRTLFRSPLAGQFAALLMAVSPFGIYLAQETRHYTLAILWILLSLSAFTIAVRALRSPGSPFPNRWPILWAIANILGVATHYFVALTLAAEALVLLGILLSASVSAWRNGKLRALLWSPIWRKIYLVGLTTALFSSGWLLQFRGVYDSKLVDWIHHGEPLREFFQPIGRLLLWLITMLILLPVEGVPLPVAIASGLLLLGILAWLAPILVRAVRSLLAQPETRLAAQTLGSFIGAAIAIVLALTYFAGTDLTLAPRYQFIYFPALVLLLGATLARAWQEAEDADSSSRRPKAGQRAVIVMAIAGLLGSLTVVTNFAYQKPERPDLVVPTLLEAHQRASADTSVLVAIVHKTHAQTGGMMGLAWEFDRLARNSAGDSAPPESFSPQFLLAHKDRDPTPASEALYDALQTLPRPLQLWLFNFTAPADVEPYHCHPDPEPKRKAPGYRYKLFWCQTR